MPMSHFRVSTMQANLSVETLGRSEPAGVLRLTRLPRLRTTAALHDRIAAFWASKRRGQGLEISPASLSVSLSLSLSMLWGMECCEVSLCRAAPARYRALGVVEDRSDTEDDRASLITGFPRQTTKPKTPMLSGQPRYGEWTLSLSLRSRLRHKRQVVKLSVATV